MVSFQKWEQVKPIIFRTIKVLLVIAVLKWIRMEIRMNEELQKIVHTATLSGRGELLIQYGAICVGSIGLIGVAIGLLWKGIEFLHGKIFWFLFAFLILDSIILYAFPDIPLLIFSSHH